jgi:hypothetical protein
VQGAAFGDQVDLGRRNVGQVTGDEFARQASAPLTVFGVIELVLSLRIMEKAKKKHHRGIGIGLGLEQPGAGPTHQPPMMRTMVSRSRQGSPGFHILYELQERRRRYLLHDPIMSEAKSSEELAQLRPVDLLTSFVQSSRPGPLLDGVTSPRKRPT